MGLNFVILCHGTRRAAMEPCLGVQATDHDFATIARSIVEQAIGEKLDGLPLPDPNAGRNPAAVALGQLGGAKGGKARAQALTPGRRAEIAERAAERRCAKERAKERP
jgi:hypothetical protein